MTEPCTYAGLPIVSTEYLFRALASLYRVDLICDVGSFDGFQALRFSRTTARVAALEPNPRNVALMTDDPALRAAGVEIFPLAAWNEDRVIGFNLVNVAIHATDDWRNQISSILPRSDYSFETQQVQVSAVRLDTFVDRMLASESEAIALWIDVEGVGFEALEGVQGIYRRVVAVHIEVETDSAWSGQHLLPDIKRLAKSYGLSPVGRSAGTTQFDIVLLNDTLRSRRRTTVRLLLVIAWLRHRVRRIWLPIRRALGSRAGRS